jgi:hypothetical protein
MSKRPVLREGTLVALIDITIYKIVGVNKDMVHKQLYWRGRYRENKDWGIFDKVIKAGIQKLNTSGPYKLYYCRQ